MRAFLTGMDVVLYSTPYEHSFLSKYEKEAVEFELEITS